MGEIKTDWTVAKRILRIPAESPKEIDFIIPWDGPDVTVIYNIPQSINSASKILFTEQGYGMKQHYFDTGLYKDSMLHRIYKDRDPEIAYDPLWKPSSKYKQDQLPPPPALRCILSQLEWDASISHSESTIGMNYEQAFDAYIKACNGKVVIKQHPKLRMDSIWFRLAIQNKVPIVKFDSAYLSNFKQIVTWSSTAMIESLDTDVVQFAKSSIGTFLKVRTVSSVNEAVEIINPSKDLVISRKIRARWLLEKFCHPRLQHLRAIPTESVLNRFRSELKFALDMSCE